MTEATLQAALRERITQLETVKSAFRELFSDFPKRLLRGEAQELILEHLEWDLSGLNRRLVSEALLELGYDSVKIMGTRFYRRSV